jgi:hypothetical protein
MAGRSGYFSDILSNWVKVNSASILLSLALFITNDPKFPKKTL